MSCLRIPLYANEYGKCFIRVQNVPISFHTIHTIAGITKK